MFVDIAANSTSSDTSSEGTAVAETTLHGLVGTYVAPRAIGGGSQYMYRQGEIIFATFAEKMVSDGWSLFPQERVGKRMPGKVGGATLKWSAYQHRLPTEKEVRLWALECPGHNVAVITGPVSSGIFVIDLDVEDERDAWAFRKLADEHLGVTPFQRVGRAPRIALFYRCVEALKKVSYTLAPKAGESPSDAIEILANGSPITVYGKHHKTGSYFSWVGSGQPLVDPPTEAPLVTEAQLKAYLAACFQRRALYKEPGALPSSPGALISPTQALDYAERNGVFTPHFGPDYAGSWKWNDSGAVVDGREEYLRAWTWAQCSANEATVRAGGDDILVALAIESAGMSFNFDATRDVAWFKDDVEKKVRAACDKLRSKEGQRFFKCPIRTATGRYEKAVEHVIESARPADGSLDWLGAGDPFKDLSGWSKKLKTTRPILRQGAAEARAFVEDRTEATSRMSAGIDDGIEAWLSDVKGDIGHVHVIPAPTGSGKTSHAMPAVTKFAAAMEGEQPLVVLAPTHDNLRDMAAIATKHGAVFDGEGGVTAVHWKGKLLAGCMREDQVRILQDLGIGSSSLCKKVVKGEDGEHDTVTVCPHFAMCGFQQQVSRAAAAKLILAPRTFLTMSTIPTSMAKPRGIIIDESVTGQMLSTAWLPLESLALDRAETRMTKREKREGLTAADLSIGRHNACRLAIDTAQRRLDIPRAFAEHPKGLQMISDALRVCSSAATAIRDIDPETPAWQIEDMAKTPTGTDLLLEIRFWKVVRDRYERLMLDRSTPLTDADGRPTPRAPGATEAALQYSEANGGAPAIRVSWMAPSKFAGVPTLMLDASCNPAITLAMFSSAEIVMHPLDIAMEHRTIAVVDRTYSKSSIIPHAEATPEAIARAVETKRDLRKAIWQITGQYAFGRVLVVGDQNVLAHLSDGVELPSNLDLGHFGDLRGRDFAKNHVAVIVIGRTEQPVAVVDGLVGALTSKLPAPEYAMDALGNGVDINGRPIMRRVMQREINLRNGYDTTIGVPEMHGPWAQALDEQWRDEETRQALGRLRPVYRSTERWEVPVAVIFSSCVPRGVIVDELTSMADLLAGPDVEIMDALRASYGVLCERITPRCHPISAERVRAFIESNAGRSSWGFTPATWTEDNGTAHAVLVSSHFEDPEKAIAEAYTQSDEQSHSYLESIDVGTPNKARVAGQTRGKYRVVDAFLSPLQREIRNLKFAAWYTDEIRSLHPDPDVARALFERELA